MYTRSREHLLAVQGGRLGDGDAPRHLRVQRVERRGDDLLEGPRGLAYRALRTCEVAVTVATAVTNHYAAPGPA